MYQSSVIALLQFKLSVKCTAYCVEDWNNTHIINEHKLYTIAIANKQFNYFSTVYFKTNWSQERVF
jgi:hypothetical protein